MSANRKRGLEDPKKKEEVRSCLATSVNKVVSVAGPTNPHSARSSIPICSEKVVSNAVPPTSVEVVPGEPSHKKPLFVPITPVSNGDHELPEGSERVKVVHSNGYSLNYVPRNNATNTGEVQKEVLFILEKNLDCLNKSHLLTQLKPDILEPCTDDWVWYDQDIDTNLAWFGPEYKGPKRFVGIDQSFRNSFPDRNSLLSVPIEELPSIPVCPDSYVFNEAVLSRPKISQQLLDLYPKEALIYSTVRSFWKPNYLGAKFQITSFPIDKWAIKLRNYPDKQLLDFLKFGWPVGFEGDRLPTLGLDNHSSSKNFEKDIEKYLQKELSLGALKGPFNAPPFEWTRTNPLMTRPKKDSLDRRVILDYPSPWEAL